MAARRTALVALCAAAVSSCDPCTGVAGCSDAPHVSLSGRILDEGTGRGAAGALVDLIHVAGPALERDSVRVVTDDEGLFTIALGTSGMEDVTVDVAVTHATGGYRVRDMVLTPTTRRGEARVLRPWSTQPRLPDLGMAYRRSVPRIPLAGIEIEFRRTGGAEVAGLENGVFRTTTSADGWFELFGARVLPGSADDVVGDLIVHAPPPFGDQIRRDVHITPSVVFREAPALRTFGVGPNIEYHFAAMYRGRFGVMVPGVQVAFTRTGGVRLTEESWTAVTDGDGRVIFRGAALDSGTLYGTLRVTPPPPAKAYDRPIELETYDDDGARFYGVIGVGPGLPYYLMLRRNGVPAAGVEVEMTRTGGIEIQPDRIITISNDTGFVSLTPEPKSEGELFANITVRPPAPLSPFTVPVRMIALDGERPGDRVLLGDWDIAAPPASIRRDPR